MAEHFDNVRASTDLKHILKVNQVSQDAVIDSKNRKKDKITEDNKILEGDIVQHSQHRKYSDKSKKTHTNSNGNALLDSTDASLSNFSESRQRGITNSNMSQPVQKLKNKDHVVTAHYESKSSSVTLTKKNPDILDSVEVVNSNKRAPSGIKNKKKLEESEFARNSKYSENVRKRNNNSYNRNSSAARNQRKNHESLRNGDEVTENFRKNREPYRSDSRGDNNRSSMNEGRNQMEQTTGIHNVSANNSKPEASEPEEEELSAELLLKLEENKILVLKKKNQRFVKARYYCELCDFHLNTKIDCDKHMKEYRHCRKKKLNEMDTLLKCIPKPNQQQFAALTAAVDKVYEAYGISEKEMKQRADIVVHLESVLKEKIPDVLMFMYGSSLTGFGLKTADINVNLTSADKDKKLTLLLKETYLSLKDLKDSGFSKLTSDFTAKIPGFILVDDVTGLTVHVIIHCYSAHCSSELLSIYSDFDIRVRKLAVAFRYWAHLCGLDQKCDGFIPPQALNLMVIYFLQNNNHQLVPIIRPPKVTEDDIGDYRKDAPGFEKMRSKVIKGSKKSNNDMSVGELWFRLLQFYCLEFDTSNVVVCIHSNQAVSRKSKPWSNKGLAVEDPYMLKRNITSMVKNSRIYEYLEDSIRKALHYFGFPRDKEGKSYIPIEVVMKVADKDTFESFNQINMKKEDKTKEAQNAGIKIDDGDDKGNECSGKEKHFATIVIDSDTIASQNVVTESESQTHKLKNYKGSQVYTGDSKSSSHSESDVITDSDDVDDVSNIDFDDVAEQQSSDTNYDGVMPSQQRSLSVSSTCRDNQSLKLASSNANVSVSISHSSNNSCISQQMDIIDDSSGADVRERPILCVCKSNGNKNVKTRSTCSSCTQSSSQEVTYNKNQDNTSTLPSSLLGLNNINSSDVTVAHTRGNKRLSESNLHHSFSEQFTEGKLHEESVNEHSQQIVKLCHYEFSKDFLTDGKGPVLVCTYCEKEGHLKNACPEDKLPEVLPLLPLTPFHVKVLSETLSKASSKFELNAIQLAHRVNFMQTLEEFIQGQFKDANLALFGSSCNGFGFNNSDMDICLTFSNRKVIDKPWLVEALARKLKHSKDLVNVQAIPTAKVPIVKFFVKHINLDGDISLYNILAQHNTKLLLCYSQIDQRVKILGYVIKIFAKVCDIGDASRGSLSSYAYILMMIYYLQQVKPPVIPVLQELYESKEKPELMIEGCNAWFMDDLNRLNKLWPDRGRNKMSLAELWLGFLRFYVEEFNYKELVVSIRQKKPLTRFEKLWNGDNIAIEDPFDVSHNLGSGLSRKMNNFIFKTFINGRMLYGSPVEDNMDMFNTYSDPFVYFFDTDLLSESRPPNDRGCRHCGKMGHLARNCPAARKEKEEQKGHQKLQPHVKQQPPKQGQAPAAQQQKIPPLLQNTNEQQKQPAVSQHQQSQPTQGPQLQRQLSQPQQQNQPYQQAQQQRKTQPSQQQQQQKQFLQPQQQQENQPSITQQQQQSKPRNPPHQQQEKQFTLLPQQQQQSQSLLHQQPQVQPFQQQRQPSQQQHDQIQLQQKQERKLPSQKEQRQSSTQEERRPLQQHQEQRHPQQHEQHKQPIKHEECRPFSQSEERKKFPKLEEQRHPPQQEKQRQTPPPPYYEEQRQHSQQERHRQSSQHEVQRWLSQVEVDRLPPQHDEQPPQVEEQRQPLQHEEQKQPPQHEVQKQPPQHEVRRLPAQHEERRQQPPQHKERRQPLQHEERRQQPQQHEERRQPSQQYEQRQSFELEQQNSLSSQKEVQQKQPFQSQHRPPSQPQQQSIQSPQQPLQETKQPFQQMFRQSEPQYHSYSPQPQQQFNQPHQQFNQPPQQYRQPLQHSNNQPFQQNSQQKVQPFQQQRQPPQQHLQQENAPLQLQHWQHPKLQQPSDREMNERNEADQWQKGLAGNINVNSSGPPGMSYNFNDHWNIQAGIPPAASNISSQVFHNSNYPQQHSMHPGNCRPPIIPPMSSLGSLPRPLVPQHPGFSYPAFTQRLPPLPLPPSMAYPPGFHHPQLNPGSGYIHANFENRRPPNQSGTHYSDQGNRSHSAGDQFMSPAVQSMFDSARGHVLNDSSNNYYRHK